MNELLKASTNFNKVRDGRTAPDFYFDLDLSSVFDRFINIAGNSFYCDANPADGNFDVYFQETDSLRGPTPFYASPGFIARIPFTQIRVVNSSPQPGKKARIVYGTDTDFQPGSVSQVTLGGSLNVSQNFKSGNAIYGGGQIVFAAGFLVETLVNPVANIRGVLINYYKLTAVNSPGGQTQVHFVARNVTPVTFDQNPNLIIGSAFSFGTAPDSSESKTPIFIPEGLGLYILRQSFVQNGGGLICANWNIL